MVCGMHSTRHCAVWRSKMETVLEVKNLKVSFRTSGGTLKAVRGISFDLERGRTMAIVGESGSGKSVTSKAILGILAGNSIVEGGEILYDGRDLLKISEEEMCRIRGDRISMIFQDPLSSLNPIVKIGRQITEAMLLKNDGNRKSAKNDFNTTLEALRDCIIAAVGESGREKVTAMIRTFDDFNIEAIRLENSYNTALDAASGMVSDIEGFLFLASRGQKIDVRGILGEFASNMKKIRDPFLTHGFDGEITALAAEIQNAKSGYKPEKDENGMEILPGAIAALLEKVREVLSTLTRKPRPDFFRIGYCKLKNPGRDLLGIPVEELNQICLEYLDKDFMLEFISLMMQGVEYSAKTAAKKKKAMIPLLKEARNYYAHAQYDRAAALKKAKELSDGVIDSIDRLKTGKDSVIYTFPTTLSGAIDRYFNAVVKNPREEARFARQSARRDAMIARGKNVDWKVVPKTVYNLDELKEEIITAIDRLTARLEENIAESEQLDCHARSIGLVDYFKEKASQVVYTVTGRMAKERAIQLMEEVGIPDPRIRYDQYPFEFSGGMRQRIVIAIALAANPDILICDEPTTALDVTIQAQILELISKLKAERNLSVIFITHDLGVVANIADDIAVMYAGKIVEYGTADDIFYDPRHPYTWALLASMPDLDTTEKLDAIPGTPPNMIYPPKGDAFAERNKYAMKIDFEQHPPEFRVSDTHWAATWLLHPDAPKTEMPGIITERIERMKKAGGG